MLRALYRRVTTRVRIDELADVGDDRVRSSPGSANGPIAMLRLPLSPIRLASPSAPPRGTLGVAGHARRGMLNRRHVPILVQNCGGAGHRLCFERAPNRRAT